MLRSVFTLRSMAAFVAAFVVRRARVEARGRAADAGGGARKAGGGWPDWSMARQAVRLAASSGHMACIGREIDRIVLDAQTSSAAVPLLLLYPWLLFALGPPEEYGQVRLHCGYAFPNLAWLLTPECFRVLPL